MSEDLQFNAANPDGHVTLLVVDDDAGLREFIQETLTGCGYLVIAADGGNEAVSLCQAHSGIIDVLVTDVVMPVVGGRELAAQIRRIRPSIQVLFVSGHSLSDLLRDGLLEPGSNFLAKPFMALALEQRVREIAPPGCRRIQSPRAADAT